MLRLRTILALACLVILSTPAAASRSGLPWPSGASSGPDALEALRGRPLDLGTVFMRPKDGWAELVASADWARRPASRYGTVAVALPMLPESARGQLARCARGDFDHHMRAVGQKLVAAGAATGLIRLGWEANRPGSFAWAAEGDGRSWVACYRRWADQLRGTKGQRFRFVWNMAAQGRFPATRIWPGSSYVDIVGVQYFDQCPSSRTEADWHERHHRMGPEGTPYGLGSWLAWAKNKGKKLAVPEWGIGGERSCSGGLRPGWDNAMFVRKMAEFFRANAGWIAFEAYFNGDMKPAGGSYRLAPAVDNPRSAAVYREMWGR
jgi:hypothetical protein